VSSASPSSSPSTAAQSLLAAAAASAHSSSKPTTEPPTITAAVGGTRTASSGQSAVDGEQRTQVLPSADDAAANARELRKRMVQQTLTVRSENQRFLSARSDSQRSLTVRSDSVRSLNLQFDTVRSPSQAISQGGQSDGQSDRPPGVRSDPPPPIAIPVSVRSRRSGRQSGRQWASSTPSSAASSLLAAAAAAVSSASPSSSPSTAAKSLLAAAAASARNPPAEPPSVSSGQAAGSGQWVAPSSPPSSASQALRDAVAAAMSTASQPPQSQPAKSSMLQPRASSLLADTMACGLLDADANSVVPCTQVTRDRVAVTLQWPLGDTKAVVLHLARVPRPAITGSIREEEEEEEGFGWENAERVQMRSESSMQRPRMDSVGRRSGSGAGGKQGFYVTVYVQPGRYEYIFEVDGLYKCALSQPLVELPPTNAAPAPTVHVREVQDETTLFGPKGGKSSEGSPEGVRKSIGGARRDSWNCSEWTSELPSLRELAGGAPPPLPPQLQHLYTKTGQQPAATAAVGGRAAVGAPHADVGHCMLAVRGTSGVTRPTGSLERTSESESSVGSSPEPSRGVPESTPGGGPRTPSRPQSAQPTCLSPRSHPLAKAFSTAVDSAVLVVTALNSSGSGSSSHERSGSSGASPRGQRASPILLAMATRLKVYF